MNPKECVHNTAYSVQLLNYFMYPVCPFKNACNFQPVFTDKNIVCRLVKYIT